MSKINFAVCQRCRGDRIPRLKSLSILVFGKWLCRACIYELMTELDQAVMYPKQKAPISGGHPTIDD